MLKEIIYEYRYNNDWNETDSIAVITNVQGI